VIIDLFTVKKIVKMEEKTCHEEEKIFTKGKTVAGKPDTFIHSKKMVVPDTVLSMQQII